MAQHREAKTGSSNYGRLTMWREALMLVVVVAAVIVTTVLEGGPVTAETVVVSGLQG